MSKTYYPEVVRNSNLSKNRKNKLPQYFHFNYNQVDNSKRYDVHQNFTYNQTINNENKDGIILGLIKLIFLPVRIVRDIVKYVFKKYDIKNNFELELKKNKLNRVRNRFMNKYSSLHTNNDEII